MVCKAKKIVESIEKTLATDSFNTPVMKKVEEDLKSFVTTIQNIANIESSSIDTSKVQTKISSLREEPQEDKSLVEFSKLPSYTKGQSTKTYAGIGSRSTPDNVLAKMTKVAKYLEDKGYKLQTGKTFYNKEEGADKAFSDGTQNKELFAPESIKANSKELKIAEELHPNWKALKEGGKKLMARNTNQVFGKNLDTPVDFVLFYAEEQKGIRPKGGTGQAVEMARRKGIPTINMIDSDWKQQLDKILENEIGKPFEGLTSEEARQIIGCKK